MPDKFHVEFEFPAPLERALGLPSVITLGEENGRRSLLYVLAIPDDPTLQVEAEYTAIVVEGTSRTEVKSIVGEKDHHTGEIKMPPP